MRTNRKKIISRLSTPGQHVYEPVTPSMEHGAMLTAYDDIHFASFMGTLAGRQSKTGERVRRISDFYSI